MLAGCFDRLNARRPSPDSDDLEAVDGDIAPSVCTTTRTSPRRASPFPSPAREKIDLSWCTTSTPKSPTPRQRSGGEDSERDKTHTTRRCARARCGFYTLRTIEPIARTRGGFEWDEQTRRFARRVTSVASSHRFAFARALPRSRVLILGLLSTLRGGFSGGWRVPAASLASSFERGVVRVLLVAFFRAFLLPLLPLDVVDAADVVLLVVVLVERRLLLHLALVSLTLPPGHLLLDFSALRLFLPCDARSPPALPAFLPRRILIHLLLLGATTSSSVFLTSRDTARDLRTFPPQPS